MSYQAMNWVTEYDPNGDVINSGEYLCLIMIANHCDTEGKCFPSLERLAKECRLSKRQVSRIVRNLESKGIVAIDASWGKNPHRYTLVGMFAQHGQDVTVMPSNITVTSCHDHTGITVTLEGDQRGHDSEYFVPERKENVEEKKNTYPFSGQKGSPHEELAKRRKTTPEFERFYADYPRRKKPLDAYTAYMRAIKRGATHESIIAALFKAKLLWKETATETNFMPYPASWLNAGSDSEDEFAPPSEQSSPTPETQGVVPPPDKIPAPMMAWWVARHGHDNGWPVASVALATILAASHDTKENRVPFMITSPKVEVDDWEIDV